jgi:DNA (cytosine-5)-methyltransferase 1
MWCSPWVGWYEAIEDLLPTLPPSQFAEWQRPRVEAWLQKHGGSALVDCTNMRESGERARSPEMPAQTLVAAYRPAHIAKALIVDCQEAGNPNARTLTLRPDVAPMFTIGATQQKRPARAILVHGSEQRTMPIRNGDEPAMTVLAASNKEPRCAFLPPGRVVAMTPRCGARFQAFPDSYELPDRPALAWRIIGNAVPPLLMQRVAESI